MRYPLHPPWCSPCCPPSVPFQAYPEYEAFMGRMVSALDPLLDAPPVDTAALGKGSLLQQLRNLRTLKPLLQAGTSGMPGNSDSKGCSPAPGVGNAEPPQEPQLGWQALEVLFTLVPLTDLQTQLGTSSQPWHSHAGLTPLLHPQGWHWGGSCPTTTRCSQPPSPRCVQAVVGWKHPLPLLLPARVLRQLPTPSLACSLSPGPDPGSLV